MKKLAHDKAAALEEAARRHSERGEMQQALALQLEAAAAWKKARRAAREADCVQAAGFLQCLLGDYLDAIASYEKALALRSGTKDTRAEAVILAQMAEVLQQAGDHGKAIVVLKRALDLCIRIGNREDMGIVLNSLGVSCRKLGKIPDAMRFYAQSLEIRRETGDFGGFGTTLHQLGVLCLEEGMLRKAHRLLEDAAAVRRAMDDKAGLGRTILSLGCLCERIGDLHQASDCYEKARQLAIHPSVADADGEVAALKNLASVAVVLGDPARALPLLDQAARVAASSVMKNDLADVLYSAGVAHTMLGQAQEALSHLNGAKALQEQSGNRSALAATLTAIGAVLLQSGEHEHAREALTRSLALRALSSEIEARANTLELLGRLCDVQGKPEDAARYYRSAAFLTANLHATSHEETAKAVLVADGGTFSHTIAMDESPFDALSHWTALPSGQRIVRYLH